MKRLFIFLLIAILLIPLTQGKVVEVHPNSATIEWKTNGASVYSIYIMKNGTFQLYDKVLVGKGTPYEAKFVEYYSDGWHYGLWENRTVVVPANATMIRYSLGGLKENSKYEVKVMGNGKVLAQDTFKTPLRGGEAHRNPNAVYLSIATIAAVMFAIILFLSRMEVKDNKAAYLYILPAISGLVLITFYPVLYGFYLSFTDYRMGHEFSANFVGLSNYAKIFTQPDFYMVFNTTVIWTFANVSLHILIGLSLALILHNKIRGRAIYRTILLLPWAIPAYISVLVWRGMFDANYGFVNYALHMNINWLGEMPYAFIAVLIANVWLGFPFMMMMFLGGLQSIPKELYEAADIDGFSRWAKFRYITLPMLKPVMTPAVLLGFIWTFNMFNVIYLMTGGGPQAGGRFSAGQTDLLITFVYNKAFRDWMFGFAAAYSVVIFLIILSFSMVYTKITSQEDTNVSTRKIESKKILPFVFLLYSSVYILSTLSIISVPIPSIFTGILSIIFMISSYFSLKSWREGYVFMILSLITDFIVAVYFWSTSNIRAYGFFKFNILSLLDIFLLAYLLSSSVKDRYDLRMINSRRFGHSLNSLVKAEDLTYPIILLITAIFLSAFYIFSMGPFILLFSTPIIAYFFLPKRLLIDTSSALISGTSLYFATYLWNPIFLIPLVVFVPAIFLADDAKFIKFFEKFVSYSYLGLMLVFVLVPVWWIFWISINPSNTLFVSEYTLIPKNPTLKHYIYALQGTPFLNWLRNSTIVAGGTTVVGIVLALTAAYGYSRFDFKGKKSTLMLFMIVQMFPGVIVLIPYYLIMYNLGLIDTYAGLIIAYAVTAIPLIVWMTKGFFDSIPRAIDEAAMVDGCTRFKAFTKVVLPLAYPGISVAALFSFITAWNEFVLAYTFMSEDHYTLPVGIMQFVGLTGTTNSQWGVFAAVSLMVSVPVVAVFLALQKYLISGMTTGSVKG